MPKIQLYIKEQKYGSKVILGPINQYYELGRIHGILGENGAGKTTLFHCMANLIPYDGKQIIPDSISYGYLPAELYVYPMISGEEFLKFYVTAKHVFFDKNKLRQLNELFELPLNDYVETYSTGMLKKLYLLGILLQHNKLLLLDEPFNGLDFKSTAFMTALISHIRDKGITVFIATHNIEHLCSFADTLSVINNKCLTFYADSNHFQEVKTNIQIEAKLKIQEVLKIE